MAVCFIGCEKAESVVEDARQAIATAGPAGAALQPTLRALQEKLGLATPR